MIRLLSLIRANDPQLSWLALECLLLCAENPSTVSDGQQELTGAHNGNINRAIRSLTVWRDANQKQWFCHGCTYCNVASRRPKLTIRVTASTSPKQELPFFKRQALALPSFVFPYGRTDKLLAAGFFYARKMGSALRRKERYFARKSR